MNFMPVVRIPKTEVSMEPNQIHLETFVEGAASSLFPIHNLPYGIFSPKGGGKKRVGAAIGKYVLDLALLEQKGLLKFHHPISLFDQGSLNIFASFGPNVWHVVRQKLQALLHVDHPELQQDETLLSEALFAQTDVNMHLPFKIEGFTDFYASEQHASNVGRLFRGKDNPLLPNWKYLPVAYNGRASTVFLSETPIHRPKGQIKLPDQAQPIFSASQKLDFELEMGIFIGMGNPQGTPIPTHEAHHHIFGLVLLNDWSARDIQSFEYQPLGPFLSKSFATSISPWVVPMAALQEFMVPLPKQDPIVSDYLQVNNLHIPDITFTVEIQPKGSVIPSKICETYAKHLYWSIEQMLSHHTINNCIMKPGDLLGSGTISGPMRNNWGSLLEMTFNGINPIPLQDGHERCFLEDGDTIIMKGHVKGEHYQIGFGSVKGTIFPAKE